MILFWATSFDWSDFCNSESIVIKYNLFSFLYLQVSRAELLFTAFIVEHNLPIACADHIGPLVKKCFPDSEIAKHYGCGRTKTTAILNNIIQPQLQSTTANHINNTPFTLGVDAGTDEGDEKLLPLTVRYMDDQEGIKVDFLDLPTIVSGTAQSMFDKISDSLDKLNINWNNLVGLSVDNTNANLGVKNSIKTRMLAKNEHMYVQGCPAHMVHNVGKKGSKEFKSATGFDIGDFLTDVYFYFDKSTKRKGQLKEFCDFVHIKYRKLLKHVDTRWLSLDTVVTRVLQSYPALQSLFLSEGGNSKKTKAKPSGRTYLGAADRKARLKGYFEDPMTEIYLLFYQNAMQSFSPILKLLQTECSMIYSLHSSLEQFVQCLLSHIKYPSALTGNLSDVDVSDRTNSLGLHELPIGFQTRSMLCKDEIKPALSKKFLEAARSFYEKATTYALNTLPLNDNVIIHATVIDPAKRRNAKINDIHFFLKRFPGHVADSEHNMLEHEFLSFRLLPDCDIDDTLAIDKQWLKLRHKYPILFKLAQLILSLPHGNADEERVFSLCTKNKTNFRGSLSTQTLASLLACKVNLFSHTACYQWNPDKSIVAGVKHALH